MSETAISPDLQRIFDEAAKVLAEHGPSTDSSSAVKESAMVNAIMYLALQAIALREPADPVALALDVCNFADVIVENIGKSPEGVQLRDHIAAFVAREVH